MKKIRVNGEFMSASAETLTELLKERGLDPKAPRLAVAVNGAVISRQAWETAAICEGDKVEIVRPFAGG